MSMKTRRRSKAAAAAAAATAPEITTRENSPARATAGAPLSLTIPDDIDATVLSNLLPEVDLELPSADSIVALYRIVVAQASDTDATQRDLEEARAEIERKDVELDQALQDKESATSELESTLDSVRNELGQVKRERDELASSRAALQEQLNRLSSTQSASSTEADALKHRIEDVEREKRDLVTVVTRLKDDSVQREEEIQSLRGNLKQARHEYQSLESELRELRSTDTAITFKLDTLQQQLQLATDQAANTTEELTAKVEEFAKYRRAKHAEMAELRTAHDALEQAKATLESQHKALQTAHTAQGRQLTQALGQIEDLKVQLAEQEVAYSSEVANLRRLVDAMEAREAESKAIVDRVESEWAGVGERAERREAALREDIEEQRHRAEDAEKRVAELEAILERMDRGEFPMPSFAGTGETPMSTPARRQSTPTMANGTPDFLMSGIMGLSPTVAMASRVQRSGKTFTEVYADYIRLQEDYARKCTEFDNMDRTLSAVLAQIEERAPILSQQRAEYERLQTEASQLASQLAQALAERDAFAASSEESAQKFQKSTRENDLLQKQLNDLGHQVRALLKDLGRVQNPALPSDEELENDDNTQPPETIDAVITNQLVLFRSIPQLQEQNQKLLKIVRELGAKMESEEREYREELEKEQSEAIREAHEAIKQLQERLESEKKTSEMTIQAYMKERDSLRSMLERSTGHAPVTVNGNVDTFTDGPVSQTALEKELSEIQDHFAAYKNEMGVDAGTLREEVISAQRSANRLRSELARATAKIEYLDERHRMSQEQSNAHARQVDSLTNRNQQLSDQYSRIEIEHHRVTEDLVTATAQIDRLRNETANLRAEKKIWENVQSRLMEENRILTVERSRLTDLMASVQKMHNDLERSGSNDRRRLESQLQILEKQTEDLRTQLTKERENVRNATLQKELDIKDLQARINKNAEEMAKTRESLVSAETSKKHLEERVAELTRLFHGHEEKLAVYERRTTGANGVAPRTDEDMSREQQLEAEVAELRSALAVAQLELKEAKAHVEQFKEISQASENALEIVNVTHNEYKASTEAELARRQSEYDALKQRLDAVQTELQQISGKYAELQQVLETERAEWATDKKLLEDAIVDVTTSRSNFDDDRQSRQNEIRELEERAKSAEDRYASEVVAHAEVLKNIAGVKEQLSKAETSARTNLSAAETAQAKLATSEASWKQQKEALDKEIADLNTRCKDLVAQNNLLHQHLESVTSQAARIREASDASLSVTAEGEQAEDVDTKMSELRSVVAYLRREKEIVELQLELSKQENLRLKTQVEHLSQSLDETRRTLSEERERASQLATNDVQNADLFEKLNQLSILRESNATLRAECERQSKRANELSTKLTQLSTELEPLKEQLHVAKAELGAKDQHVQRLEEESQRWKERNSQLLSKYDRIDPAEVQSLKEEIDKFKALKEETDKKSIEREKELTDKIATHEATIKHLKEVGQRNNNIARTRFEQHKAQTEQLNTEMSALKSQLEALTAERDALKAQSDVAPSINPAKEQELSQQVDAFQAEKAALEKSLADLQSTGESSFTARVQELSATVESLTTERDKLLMEKASWTTTTQTPADSQQQWESEKASLIQARDEAITRAEAASEQAQKATSDVQNIKFANEKFQAKLQDLNKARAADTERAKAQQEAAVNAAIEKLKDELQSAPPSATPDEIIARHAEELRTLEERLTVKYQEDLKAAVDTAIAATRAEMATVAPPVSGDQKQAIEAAIAAHDRRLKEQHEQEIAAAVERGRMEQAAKAKLKDQQLVKAQIKLKELEAQILEWRNAGLIPQATTPAPPAKAPSHPAPTSAASASTSTKAPAVPTQSVAAAVAKVASTSAPPAGAAAKGLPRKPSLGPGAVVAEVAAAGRGRGGARGARGGIAIRGTAGQGRGGAPAGGAANAGESVSIIGAAGKRAREDGEAAADDSLSKRLKPAESKPVTLRRDRVPPPS